MDSKEEEITDETFYSLATGTDPSPPQDSSYVLMDTVSLETSADSAALSVHFKASAQEGEENKRTSNEPVESSASENDGNLKETVKSSDQDACATTMSLSHYFDPPEPLPIQDTMGHTFFDSLSSGMSPMMKSVSDITALDTGIEVGTEAASSESAVPQVSDKMSKPTEDVSAEQSGTMPHATDDTQTSANVTEEESFSPEQPKPLLSNLFMEEKSGSDLLGKAFFDSLPNQTLVFETSPSTNVPSPHSASSNGPQSLDFLFLDPQEKDQFYNAWIPSPKTKQVLVTMATASQGSFFPEKSDLTMPGVIITDQMADPVKTLMSDLNLDSAHLRTTLTADHVTQDENGLRQLIKAKCIGAAINLTGRLLSVIGQGPGADGHPTRHSPYSLQLWYTRIALFVKSRKFQCAEAESQAFGNLDRPDIYYEFYPDVFTGRKGSMAPFSFRLLLAECPQFWGNYSGALDRLYSVLSTVQKILENVQNGLSEDGEEKELSEQHCKASLKLWKERECKTLFSILNCMVSQKDYAMAMDVVSQLQDKLPSKAAEMQAALGKIYLQLGDVHAASTCFNQVVALRSQSAPTVRHTVEDLIHKALMCIVQNSYGDAYKHFSQALTLEPDNVVLINNMAVCLLYMGRLKEAISLVEGVVMPKTGSNGKSTSHLSILKVLHEGLLFNTCILYELESFHCDVKKKEVLNVVAQHAGDSFQTACLKIDVKAVK